MTRGKFYTTLLLLLIWQILSGYFSILPAVTGIFFSIVCAYLFYHFLPYPKAQIRVNYLLFAFYPLFMIGRIYLSAFQAIKLIITGAEVEIVKTRTRLSNNFLRTMLANSFTLTPGSISLDLEEDEISVLLLIKKGSRYQDAVSSCEAAKEKMENFLLKIEKQPEHCSG